MENKIIAEALLEIAKERSETTLIEISAEDKELIKAAKKIGIVLPSPDLAIMKTVYAEIDKVNKNGVILPRKAVEEGLPTLNGKQVNWEHKSAGQICGYIIDAKINGDLIETTSVIFKSLFPEEMDTVKERFKNKELCVSFEIWNRDEEGNSVVKELSNGQREMTKIVFHGQGLLLSSPPACPKAKVFKMLAKEILDAEKIVDKVFNEDLIFAQLAIEEPKCKNCDSCNCDKKEDSKVEVKIEEIEKIKIEETKASEVTPEDTKAEAVIETPKADAEVKPEETKTEAEVKPEEIKAAEIAPVRLISETVEELYLTVYTPKPDGSGNEVSKKGKRKTTYKYSDGTENIAETEFEVVDKYTQAEIDEKLNSAKSELQKIIDDKVTEIKTLTEAKDKEISNLKQELESKIQEIEKSKTVEVAAVKKQIDLDVGAVEANKEDKFKKIHDEVDKKAFKR
jgi:hypothetical protein